MTSNGTPNRRVLVIGSGPSGLTSIKACREEGIEVICVERTEKLGGLWRYKEDHDQASVARTTIINTSKEFSGYSDFPPPAEFPNFMHNTKMYRYFEMYAEHFELEQYIRYRTKVVEVTFNDDYEQTGRWRVRMQKVDTGEEYSEVFDGVMVCTGHHETPLVPTFKGQERFQGKIVHTHSYKTSEGYQDKVVVVVGSGNSGVDAAVELAPVAKQVYLAARRGVWLRGRVGHSGRPVDRQLSTLALHTVSGLLPPALVNKAFEVYTNWMVCDHDLYGLRPDHPYGSQHPTINDALPNMILSGRVQVKRNIKEFTETGIIFEHSEKEVPVDVVVLATGYVMSLPFIDQSIISHSENNVSLFKNMYNPNLERPETLAMIGLVQPLGPVHTTSELQARWFAAIIAGHKKLPSKSEMKAIMADDKVKRDARFYGSPRHALEIDYISYIHQIAEYLGVKPNIKWYLLTDPKLAYHLMFGMFATYQFRLTGRHKWSGARQAILELDKRIDAALQTVKD